MATRELIQQKTMTHSSKNEYPSKKASPEVINPLSIQGAGRRGDRHQVENRRRPTVFLFSFFLITVLALGGWLLITIQSNPIVAEPVIAPPGTESERLTVSPDSAETASKDQRTPVPAAQTVQKEHAVRQRTEYSRVRSMLENKGVSEWGGASYSEMVILGQEAETLFSQNDFNASIDRFTAALEKANTLVGETQAALQRFIEEGLTALSKGNGQTAQKNFQAALLLDPSNAVARNGLAKVKHAEAVMQLVESGNAHESDKNFSQALTDYQNALALDPEAEQAIDGRTRVEAILEEEQFQHLMSAGQAALAQKDLQKARSWLLEAKAIRPDDPGVADALAQTNQEIRLRRIENHHQTAIQAENSENWAQTLASYEKVLQLDRNIRFAVQGAARAREYIRINKRISYFLEKPSALESDRQLQNALSLLDETENLEARGPLLNARISELKTLVEAAKTPVRLILESDNQTEVAVYKIGKFGRFAVRELDLRPGTYTVVGSREGYQDVRKIIRVEPGQQPQRISVICKVKV